MPHDAHSHDDSHGHDSPGAIPDTGKLYETRDVSLVALRNWLMFLFAFVIGTAIVTFFIYKFFVPNGEERSQFPLTHERQIPPEPKLQADPVAEIKDYRANEVQALNTYGRDPRTGAIHIPIDHAIDLTLPELPIRAGADQIDMRKTTDANTPSQYDGKAPSQPASATEQPGASIGTNAAPQNMPQPGMNPGMGTSPTSVAPGTVPPSIPTGVNSAGGGSPSTPEGMNSGKP